MGTQIFVHIICKQGLRRNKNLPFFLALGLEKEHLALEMLPPKEGE